MHQTLTKKKHSQTSQLSPYLLKKNFPKTPQIVLCLRHLYIGDFNGVDVTMRGTLLPQDNASTHIKHQVRIVHKALWM